MPSLHLPISLSMPSAAPLFRRAARQIRHALVLGWARRQERRALAELAPHMLRDIGLTPAERRAEIRKYWWEV